MVQLTSQMATQLNGLSQEITASRERVKSLFETGGKTLSKMRQLVSATGPVEDRTNSFAAETVTLTGIIADLQQTSIAPAVKRTADDLYKTFIAPAADGRTVDLVDRQNQVVGKVEQAIKSQSTALSTAADEILSRPAVVPVRFVPLSTAEAVLHYATDFLPSWAGAISLDLMPAVLIFIHVIVHAAIRREEGARSRRGHDDGRRGDARGAHLPLDPRSGSFASFGAAAVRNTRGCDRRRLIRRARIDPAGMSRRLRQRWGTADSNEQEAQRLHG